MPSTPDADVALIHIAGGEARITPPAGTLAESPPRRAARGRADDLLFVTVGLHSPSPVSPGLLDQLARLAADAFYGTPGSVTAALRQAAAEVNDHLLELNQNQDEPVHLQGRMMAGILRGQDLYLCQCGMGQAILVRPGQVTRLSSEEASNRPLGLNAVPYVRYHHAEVRPGDLIITTTAPPPGWSEPTLSGLSGLDPAMALDRLVAASATNLTGVLMRLAGPGEAVSPAPPTRTPGIPRRPTGLATVTGRTRRRAARPSPAEATSGRTVQGRVPSPPGRARRADRPAAFTPPPAWREKMVVIGDRLRAGLAVVGEAATKLLTRMAPGLLEHPRPGTFDPSLLAATAVTVPLVVVMIASVVYFHKGRVQQFQDYLAQAQSAVDAAQRKPSPEEALPDWQAASAALDAAEGYRQTDDSQALRQQVQAALDSIEKVIRLDYRPTVSGGFGAGARITALAASATDLYVLDETRVKVWHAWFTGRGYEIDRDFDCLNGPESVEGMTTPVDLVSLSEPGPLLREGMAAIDQDGTVVYCAPGNPPAYSQLAPPDTGWGRIQAVEVYGDKLYVLDPPANAIWIFDAGGGLFSQNPSLYFAEYVPDLGKAIDLAMAQDQLLILFADGHMESCRRSAESDGSGVRIQVECEENLQFQDERPGQVPSDHIPKAEPARMVYSPPPEPSLYFLDSISDNIYVYSMRLVFQGKIQPLSPLRSFPTALTLGPPNRLFLAVDDQVYFAEPGQ